jgi:predicted Zn-dependent protease with MMP-like domain
MPPLQRTALSATVAMSLGLVTIVVLQGGLSDNTPLRLVEGLGIAVVAVFVLGGLMAWVGAQLSTYTSPEDEEEFERLVINAEGLARSGVAAEPEENEFMELDPLDDKDFEELVREALDGLPDLLRHVVENHNVAVVISDGGRRRGAYGLYHGDGATRDDVPDRIVIYRDTLRRDFGHDPELLREQVTVTVRHELAHHIGFDELGVRGLGL